MGRKPLDPEKYIGQKFNRLTVESYDKKFRGKKLFNCRCDCGNVKSLAICGVSRGKPKSCGKCNLIKRGYPVEDLTHKIFDKLLVLGRSGCIQGRVAWKCLCSCGKHRRVLTNHLLNKKVRACKGCTNRYASPYISYIFPLESSKRRLIKNYLEGAKRRNLSWELDEETFNSYIKQDCYYCGSSPSNIIKHKVKSGELLYNGIDRLDNNVGYLKTNCVACCKNCNIAKRCLGKQEFLDLVTQIYKHRVAIQNKENE